MIRYANKYDFPDIIRLIHEFAVNSDIAKSYNPLKWSKTHVEAIVSDILAGKGFILIDDKKTALMCIIKAESFWIKEEIRLVEVLLHSPNKITMIKMIKEYIKIAKELKSQNKIAKAFMMSNRPANFEKLGLKQAEIHWEI